MPRRPRKWRFIDQADEVIKCKVPIPGARITRDRAIVKAQIIAPKLLARYAASRKNAPVDVVADKTKCVELWLTATPRRVSCWVIRISEDGGRTWVNPLA